MAKLPVILVRFAMILLLQSQGSISKNHTGLWVLNVRGTQTISVRPDGTIVSSSSDPSLYSLFRVHTFHEDPMSMRAMFTFESMATNRFICMNKKGKLITKERDKTPGGKKKRSPPSHLCFFHSWNFGDWNQMMVGLYTHGPRSNGTVGRFIAFDENGIPFKYSRKLTKIHRKNQAGIVITLRKPKSIKELIKLTRFQRCNGVEGSQSFNRAVRRCLKTTQDVVAPNRLVRKNFFKILRKCQKDAESSLCYKKTESRKNNGRNRELRKKKNSLRIFNQSQEYGNPCDCAKWI